MAKELEKKLLEELSRFKEINHNTQNLDEQMVGGVSSLGMGSHLERLSKRFNMDEQEVEDEVPTEEDFDKMQISRHALHATAINFPYNGGTTVRASIPFDLAEWLKNKLNINAQDINLEIDRVIKDFF